MAEEKTYDEVPEGAEWSANIFRGEIHGYRQRGLQAELFFGEPQQPNENGPTVNEMKDRDMVGLYLRPFVAVVYWDEPKSVDRKPIQVTESMPRPEADEYLQLQPGGEIISDSQGRDLKSAMVNG